MKRHGPDEAEERLVYSTDKTEIVRKARAVGMSDAQIIRHLVANEYGEQARKRIIQIWAKALGLTNEAALAVAKRAGLIRT